MKTFVTLFLKDKEQNKFLLDFFKGSIGANVVMVERNNLSFIFDENPELSFIDIANFINYELLIPTKLFKARAFNNEVELNNYLDMVDNVTFANINKDYFEERDLVIHHLGDKELIKKMILGVFYQDEMLDVVKEFLDCNMNISLASRNLYMHRNTVINKIDRFIEKTGYNIKEFKDAFVIYHLL